MDLIDRQAAIDALKPCAGVGNRALEKLRALPSVEPERKTGRWEKVQSADCGIDFRCSACHRYRFHNGEMRKKYKYCPNCGSYNGGGA